MAWGILPPGLVLTSAVRRLPGFVSPRTPFPDLSRTAVRRLFSLLSANHVPRSFLLRRLLPPPLGNASFLSFRASTAAGSPQFFPLFFFFSPLPSILQKLQSVPLSALKSWPPMDVPESIISGGDPCPLNRIPVRSGSVFSDKYPRTSRSAPFISLLFPPTEVSASFFNIPFSLEFT